jgi:S1-C subfamily serine protease
MLISVVTIEGYDYYQFDATVDHGCSGGPALNLGGQVIAVVALKAKDEATSELRKKMRQFGETFERGKDTQAEQGLSYGIPVQTLARALASVEKGDSAADRADTEHTARVLLQRSAVLGNLHLLEAMVDVPPEVRQEWELMRQHIASSGTAARAADAKPLVALLPESVARELRAELASKEVQKTIAAYGGNLADKLSGLQDSPHLDEAVKKDLQGLYNRVKSVEKLATRPPKKYDDFSARILASQESLDDYVARLTTKLAMQSENPGEADDD